MECSTGKHVSCRRELSIASNRYNDRWDNVSSRGTRVLSVEVLKQRFYVGYESPFDRFNQEAMRLSGKDSVVLHAGCGADSSVGFQTMARMTIGIDLDEWILNNSDVNLAVIGNLSCLPLVDECVDFIASRWVLEHLRCPDLFLWETARVLRPGGYLLVLTTNLYHYFALAVRLTSHSVQQWFVQNVLGGDPNDVFPTFYRANTSRRIRSLAAKNGLVAERIYMLEGAPSILSFSPLAYLAGITYERMVNRFKSLSKIRGAILAVFRKLE